MIKSLKFKIHAVITVLALILPLNFARSTEDEFNTALNRLLSQATRPTMTQIKELVLINKMPSWFNNSQAFDKNTITNLQDVGPSIIAQFEKIFPGMNYAPLGRDSVLLGDILEAYYQSIGQTDRVYRVNASGASLTNNPDDFVDFIKDQTLLDRENHSEHPGVVLFDSTRWSDSSQSRQFMNAIYKACISNPRCNGELLLEKFTFLNVGAQNGMYPKNVFTPSFDLLQFQQKLAKEIAWGKTPSDIISIKVPTALTYSEAYHDTFQKLQRYSDGKIYALPGNPSNREIRLNIIRTQVEIFNTVNTKQFEQHVEHQAELLGFTFPKYRVSDLNQKWEIRSKAPPPPSQTKRVQAQKIKVAAAGLLMALGVIAGGSTYYVHDQNQKEQILLLEKQQSELERKSMAEMDSTIPNAKSVQDFFQILKPKGESPSRIYIRHIQNLWNENLHHFLKLKPDFDEVQKLKAILADSDDLETLIRYQLKSIISKKSTPESFVLALKRPDQIPMTDSDYTIVHSIMTNEMMKSYFSLQKEISKDTTMELLSLLSDSNQISYFNSLAMKIYKGRDMIQILISNIKNLDSEDSNTLAHYLRDNSTNIVKEYANANHISNDLALKQIKKDLNSVTLIIGLMDGLLKNASTFSEAAEYVTPGVDSPSETYLTEIDHLVKKHLRKLASLVHSENELAVLKNQLQSIDTLIELIQMKLKESTSASQYLDLLAPAVENPSSDYLAALQKLAHDNINLFYRLKPTNAEIALAKQRSSSIDYSILLSERAIKTATKASDINTFLEPGIDYPRDEYLEALDQLRAKYARNFAAQVPDKIEIAKSLRAIKTISTGIELRKELLRTSQSAENFVFILDPFIESPSTDYLSAINELIEKHSAHFFALKPTAKQLVEVKSKFDSIESITKFINSYVHSNQMTVDSFVRIITPGVENPSDLYLESLAEIYENQLHRIRAMEISSESAEQLRRAAPTEKAQESFDKVFKNHQAKVSEHSGISKPVNSEASIPHNPKFCSIALVNHKKSQR